MKLIKTIVFFSMCLVTCKCLTASDLHFRFYQKLKKMVAAWDNIDASKRWPAIDPEEEFEFFVSQLKDWGMTPPSWYVIRVAKNTSGQTPSNSKQLQVYLHYGHWDTERPMKKFEDYKASEILDTIGINEFFQLPKFQNNSKYGSFKYGINMEGPIFVLGRHRRNGVVTEVFRELGHSVPLDNIHQMLRELTMPANLMKMERVEKALQALWRESKPKQSLRDLVSEVKPDGPWSDFLQIQNKEEEPPTSQPEVKVNHQSQP